ncbi:MAG: 7-cyano-7-deazaguanine synthase QueC [Bdellovibrionales bacterium]|nr:7-cyano-7-deazaguanine synthase QueC [Bdellovibrionales bacterium]
MKSVVLLSAGLDSTVNLFEAHARGQILEAITFSYGQRAAEAEVRCSQKLCAELGVPHRVVNLPWFSEFTRTALVDRSVEVPTHVKIGDLNSSHDSAKKVWVPNRNGIFLNIGAGFAEGLGAEVVVTGFNAEEAQTFPDNTPEFLETLDRSFHFSTASGVRTQCWTTHLHKTAIVRRGMELRIPFELMWPCYHGGKNWCLTCESCLRFKRARENAATNEWDRKK